jgi:hypothetical protein
MCEQLYRDSYCVGAEIRLAEFGEFIEISQPRATLVTIAMRYPETRHLNEAIKSPLDFFSNANKMSHALLCVQIQNDAHFTEDYASESKLLRSNRLQNLIVCFIDTWQWRREGK